MSDIWDKEIDLTPEDKKRLGITDEQIEMLKNKKQNKSFSDYLKTGEQLATSALNGLSQGFNDEYEGGASALGYGIANLGMRAGHALGLNDRVPTEDVWNAVKRGYIKGRDYRRQVLDDARQNMPWLSTGMEATGAVASPANKILGAIGTGVLSGYGNSNTNGLGEISRNMAVGAIGNKIGEKAGTIIPNRAWAPTARAVLRESISTGSQNGLQSMYNQE